VGKDELGLARVSEQSVTRAAQEGVRALADKAFREAMVERNFALGKRYYSLESLENYLRTVLRNRNIEA